MTTGRDAVPMLPGESLDAYLARARQAALDKLLADNGVVLVGGVPHIRMGEPPVKRASD